MCFEVNALAPSNSAHAEEIYMAEKFNVQASASLSKREQCITVVKTRSDHIIEKDSALQIPLWRGKHLANVIEKLDLANQSLMLHELGGSRRSS